MISSIKKFITASVIGAVSLSSLTACVVSDDPYVNSAATAAVTAGAVSLLLYSIHDGYYYDQDYRQMPRHYRPPQNVQIVRVNNIHEYRNTHPRPSVRHQPVVHQRQEIRRNEQQIRYQEQQLRRNEQEIRRQNEMQRRNERQIQRQEQRKQNNNRKPAQRRYQKYDY